MTNMEAFNEIAARVLEHLFAAFPQEINLAPGSFVDESDRNSVSNFHYTVKFLAREGLVRYEVAADDGAFFEVVLTGRGLAALNAAPDLPGERETFGQRIFGASGSGSKEALGRAVNQLITAIAAGRVHYPSW